MRKLTLSLLISVFVSVVTIGCDSNPPGQPRSTSAATITVVGDKTASMVINELAKQGFNTVATLDQQARSSVIVVVQDSTVGPLPIHMEIAKSLENRSTEDYLWVFTNTAMVNDQELLELEELECREIFNSQGLPGDDIVFGFDSPSALVAPTSECPKGWSAISAHIRKIAR